MTKKQGLGRGLDALIPTSGAGATNRGSVRVVRVDEIRPNPRQPRTHMEPTRLAELAESIRTLGLIQPLIVTEAGSGYTLIAGERRWRASQLAGLTEVPVVVKEATSQEMLEIALVENIQRDDLNPLEEGYAYQQLMEDFGLTQAEVAERVGKGRSTVANLVRLVALPDNIQQAVVDGRISGAHGRALLSLPSPEMQTAAMNQILRLDLSVRQTETLVRSLLADKKPAPRQRSTLSPELTALQHEFETSLGTRVSIETAGQGGRLVIHYFSDDDLQALYEAIVRNG